MNQTRARFCVVLIFCFSLLGVPKVQAQFEDLARWVPESANCLVMVQAKKILNSELAKKENWLTSRSKAFRSGAAFFPTSTTHMLIASQIDFEFMDSVWNVGVFEKEGTAINIVDVSKRIQGNIETIGDRQALLLPNQSYLVRIDDRTLATMTPGNRQATTRWISKKSVGQMNLSPYLTNAVQFADDNADVIVAFDLEGVVHEDRVTQKLKESTLVNDALVERYAKLITSMKGLTLGITVRDKIVGSIKLDFGEDPTTMVGDAKAILIHALKKNGLMIDDISNWNTSVSGNSILVSGAMDDDGLREVGSLIHQPLVDDFTGADNISGTPEVDMATKTLQYWGDVQTVVEKVRRLDVNDLATFSKWFDRYSLQLDSISILGVDPVMVQYGTYVANSFRDVSGGLDASNLGRAKSMAEQGFAGPGGGTFNYGYGYGTIQGRNYTLDSRMSANTLSTMGGKNDAKNVMRELESETAKVRRAMTEKYQLNF